MDLHVAIQTPNPSNVDQYRIQAFLLDYKLAFGNFTLQDPSSQLLQEIVKQIWEIKDFASLQDFQEDQSSKDEDESQDEEGLDLGQELCQQEPVEETQGLESLYNQIEYALDKNMNDSRDISYTTDFLKKLAFTHFNENDIKFPDPQRTLQYLDMFRAFIQGRKKKCMNEYNDYEVSKEQTQNEASVNQEDIDKILKERDHSNQEIINYKMKNDDMRCIVQQTHQRMEKFFMCLQQLIDMKNDKNTSLGRLNDMLKEKSHQKEQMNSARYNLQGKVLPKKEYFQNQKQEVNEALEKSVHQFSETYKEFQSYIQLNKFVEANQNLITQILEETKHKELIELIHRYEELIRLDQENQDKILDIHEGIRQAKEQYDATLNDTIKRAAIKMENAGIGDNQSSLMKKVTFHEELAKDIKGDQKQLGQVDDQRKGVRYRISVMEGDIEDENRSEKDISDKVKVIQERGREYLQYMAQKLLKGRGRSSDQSNQ